MALKPIKVWVTPSGPNPWKVIFVLEELEVPYEIESFSFEEVKQKPYIDINPNGRVPAIQDPNTTLTLWETGAIILYLIEQYDKSHKLSFDTFAERHLCNQWLAFQISGQGPYFGQASWFNNLHPTQIESAIARYNAELKRILGVLEVSLEGKDWLVGNKLTFADFAFATWNDLIHLIIKVDEKEKFNGFPNVKNWHERMTSRPSWKKIMDTRTELVAEQNVDPNTGLPIGVASLQEWEEKIAKKREEEIAQQ